MLTLYLCIKKKKLIKQIIDCILPNSSKIYEKLMYQQFYDHFDSILPPKQCCFLKGHSAQHCLIVMMQKLKESGHRGDEFGALFTDLSKAFDDIDHNLLVTKLSWYGVTTKLLHLIFFLFKKQDAKCLDK